MKIPGIHVTTAEAFKLLEIALSRLDDFDALVYTGRTGGLLAAMQLQHQSLKTVPCCVLRSKPKQSPVCLRHYTRELGELVESLLPAHLRLAYQNWAFRCPNALKPAIPSVRLLFIDDTVTALPEATYAYVREACQAWQVRLIGYVSGCAEFENGWHGFNSDEQWQRYVKAGQLLSSPQALIRWLRQLEEDGLLDEKLREILEEEEEARTEEALRA